MDLIVQSIAIHATVLCVNHLKEIVQMDALKATQDTSVFPQVYIIYCTFQFYAKQNSLIVSIKHKNNCLTFVTAYMYFEIHENNYFIHAMVYIYVKYIILCIIHM